MLSFCTYRGLRKDNGIVFKQELLLRRALRERGLLPEEFRIETDHLNGISTLNGESLGVIYPDSFFYLSRRLHHVPKYRTFYFKGNMDDGGGRQKMLEPFNMRKDAKVVATNRGRMNDTKDQFDFSYFIPLAGSKFGLCPNQIDWPGATHWTYRFIECLMVKTFPVLFKDAPLSPVFVKEFHFTWQDIVLERDFRVSNYQSQVTENFELAKSVFRLPIHVQR